MNARVLAISLKAKHGTRKLPAPAIRLIAGIGVEGDAHAGATEQHRDRWRKDFTRPNIRQVHLIHAELFAELRQAGFAITPGLMGENIATRGLDLLALPRGARLHLGEAAVVELTGLRNPCYQLDQLQKGLMAACLGKDDEGGIIRKAGVMAVVVTGGEVRAGDPIRVERPPEPHERLQRV